MGTEDRNAIGKALEKARREEDAGAKVPATRPPEETTPRATTPPPAPVENIEYDDTRVEVIPERTLKENRIVAGAVRDQNADIFRMLRAQTLKRLKATGGNSLAICSGNVSEGKTLVAANLACSIAMDPNYTVLLVDLDLRRPRIQEVFGLKDTEFGLCDYLEGKAELSQILVNPGIDGLVLLPVRRPLLNSSELLASPRMLHLLSELKSRYPNRITLFDLPPLLAGDDNLVVLPHIDASLLVIREGTASAGEITRSLRLLESHNLLGTVLNDSAEGHIHPYY